MDYSNLTLCLLVFCLLSNFLSPDKFFFFFFFQIWCLYAALTILNAQNCNASKQGVISNLCVHVCVCSQRKKKCRTNSMHNNCQGILTSMIQRKIQRPISSIMCTCVCVWGGGGGGGGGREGVHACVHGWQILIWSCTCLFSNNRLGGWKWPALAEMFGSRCSDQVSYLWLMLVIWLTLKWWFCRSWRRTEFPKFCGSNQLTVKSQIFVLLYFWKSSKFSTVNFFFSLWGPRIQRCLVLRPWKVRKFVRTNQFQVKHTKMGTGRKFVTFQYKTSSEALSVPPGAVNLVLWHHWMHATAAAAVTSENQFHCTRLYMCKPYQSMVLTKLLNHWPSPSFLKPSIGPKFVIILHGMMGNRKGPETHQQKPWNSTECD